MDDIDTAIYHLRSLNLIKRNISPDLKEVQKLQRIIQCLIKSVEECIITTREKEQHKYTNISPTEDWTDNTLDTFLPYMILYQMLVPESVEM